MKTKIKDALKTKYKALGFSDQAIEAVAGFLSATVTEEAGIDAAVAGVEGLLKAVQSDTDKARAEKVKLEAKLAELEGKRKPDDDPEKKPTPPTDEPPAWAKSLIDQNKELAKKLSLIEGEKITTSRKQLLEAAFPENTPAKYREQTIKGLERQKFETDEDFTAFVNDVKTTAEELSGLAAAKGGVFKRPAGASGEPGKDKVPEAVEARIKAREAEQAPSPIAGMPK
ncbi:MAG: hypothetical protein NTZ69_16010 [Bacteroidia bacterium]|nr:hypothetical protein [Bacteroidia bacterium]